MMSGYLAEVEPVRAASSFGRLSEENAARLVEAQYERTEAATAGAVREMVVFGAVLEAVERRLLERRTKEGLYAYKPSLNGNTKEGLYAYKPSPNGNTKEGLYAYKPSLNGNNQTTPTSLTLKGWLAEHCPKIEYTAAYNYLLAARGARRLARLSEEVPLLALMGEKTLPDGELEAYRKKVMGILEKSSLRMLRGEGLGKVGRAGKDEGYLDLKESDEEAAAEVVFPPIQHYMKHRGAIQTAVTLLPAERLEEGLATLKEFCAVVEAELKEREKPRRAWK